MQKNKYLSILFCVSSGLNEDSLGCDEASIINICNIVLDSRSLKVCTEPLSIEMNKKLSFI